MQLLHEREDLRALREAWRKDDLRVGFVPTMGALHQGHLSLIHTALAHTNRVVVSLFVNPTQFGPNEDLDNYPRDLDGDRAKVEAAGAHVLFVPSTAVMYPDNAQTFVRVKDLTKSLCGATRPEHFEGVTTIVSKLFHLVTPDVAVFGQKDFQQLAVIRQMVRDLLMDVEVIGAPTIREADGLAMSSRNAYLSSAARSAASCLAQSIRLVRERFAEGERDVVALQRAATALIEQTPLAHVEYIEVRDASQLAPIAREADAKDRLFLAIHIDGTRLIDNAALGGDDPFAFTPAIS